MSPPGLGAGAAVAAEHLSALRCLAGIPYAPDYFTPQEILVLMAYCIQYDVDLSLFVDAEDPPPTRGRDGEAVLRREQSILVARHDRVGRRVLQSVPCRMRLESGLLDDLEGVWIPDLNLKAAHQLVGELRRRVADCLENATGGSG